MPIGFTPIARPATRFARIPIAVQPAPAPAAAARSGLSGQIFIDAQEECIELGVQQHRVAHWGVSHVFAKLRDTLPSLGDRPIAIPEGDFLLFLHPIISNIANSPFRTGGRDTQANRNALRAFLTPETTRWQYTHGVPDETIVSPDGQNLDNFYLARPGADEVQLDLFGDYNSNVALYPSFQEYFRTHKPPLLAVWGKNDPFFLPPGAEAFKRDIPRAVVRFFDTGHFALETHAGEIAESIRNFLK
jgi:pimeloyl-ACP methyl ester carboxylesterase